MTKSDFKTSAISPELAKDWFVLKTQRGTLARIPPYVIRLITVVNEKLHIKTGTDSSSDIYITDKLIKFNDLPE